MLLGRNMALCPDCAENLKDIRKVVLHRVTARKERCEECGKVRHCDDYNVGSLDGSE
jgi:uncharacterized Zn finger protein